MWGQIQYGKAGERYVGSGFWLDSSYKLVLIAFCLIF